MPTACNLVAALRRADIVIVAVESRSRSAGCKLVADLIAVADVTVRARGAVEHLIGRAADVQPRAELRHVADAYRDATLGGSWLERVARAEVGDAIAGLRQIAQVRRPAGPAGRAPASPDAACRTERPPPRNRSR